MKFLNFFRSIMPGPQAEQAAENLAQGVIDEEDVKEASSRSLSRALDHSLLGDTGASDSEALGLSKLVKSNERRWGYQRQLPRRRPTALRERAFPSETEYRRAFGHTRQLPQILGEEVEPVDIAMARDEAEVPGYPSADLTMPPPVDVTKASEGREVPGYPSTTLDIDIGFPRDVDIGMRRRAPNVKGLIPEAKFRKYDTEQRLRDRAYTMYDPEQAYETAMREERESKGVSDRLADFVIRHEGNQEAQQRLGHYRNNRYFPYDELSNADTQVIGYGHDLTPQEKQSGVIEINGQFVNASDGLTQEQSRELLTQDLDKSFEGARRVYTHYGLDFDALSEWAKEMAIELVFNMGEGRAKKGNPGDPDYEKATGFHEYVKFRQATVEGNYEAAAREGRRGYRDKEGKWNWLDRRSKDFARTFIPTANDAGDRR